MVKNVLLLACFAVLSIGAQASTSSAHVTEDIRKQFTLPLNAASALHITSPELESKAPEHVASIQNVIKSQDFALTLLNMLDDYFKKPVLLIQQSTFHQVYDMRFVVSKMSDQNRYQLALQGRVLDQNGNVIYQENTTAIPLAENPVTAYHMWRSLGANVRQFIENSLRSVGTDRLNTLVNTPPGRLPLATADVKPDGLHSLLNSLSLRGSGTGFYINAQGDLLTARHVISQCVSIEVVEPGGNIPAEMVADERYVDLAILRTGQNTEAYARLPGEGDTPKLGQQVAVVGYPLSDLLSNSANLTLGNVSSLSGLQGDKKYIQVSAPIQPGNSGGPVSSYRGTVLGVVNSTLNSIAVARQTGNIPQNVNFAIQSSTARKFLNRYNIPFHTEATDIQRDLESTTEYMQTFTRQILCKG